jgi:two-component system cell cycle sensor histidine kinase/response regulator CckA
MATILVVDDDPDVNELTAMLLSQRGHVVLCAANGAKALTILQEGPPIDLLLTDVIMPEMDVVTLSKHAKAMRPHLQIIFMSGHAAGLRLPDNGKSRFLRKPWRAEMLFSEIDHLLAHSGEPPGA